MVIGLEYLKLDIQYGFQGSFCSEEESVDRELPALLSPPPSALPTPPLSPDSVESSDGRLMTRWLPLGLLQTRDRQASQFLASFRIRHPDELSGAVRLSLSQHCMLGKLLKLAFRLALNDLRRSCSSC